MNGFLKNSHNFHFFVGKGKSLDKVRKFFVVPRKELCNRLRGYWFGYGFPINGNINISESQVLVVLVLNVKLFKLQIKLKFSTTELGKYSQPAF